MDQEPSSKNQGRYTSLDWLIIVGGIIVVLATLGALVLAFVQDSTPPAANAVNITPINMLGANSARLTQQPPAPTPVSPSLIPTTAPGTPAANLPPTTSVANAPTSSMPQSTADQPTTVGQSPTLSPPAGGTALNAPAQAQLDQAVANTENATGLHFVFNANMTMTLPNETGTLVYEGNGDVGGLGNFNTMALQLDSTGTLTLNGQQQSLDYNFRMVDGVLYAQGIVPDVAQTEWLAIPITEALNSISGISDLSAIPGMDSAIGMMGTPDPNGQEGDFSGLLDAFGLDRFVTHWQMTSQNPVEAIFVSDVDLPNLLVSQEMTNIVVSVVSLSNLSSEAPPDLGQFLTQWQRIPTAVSPLTLRITRIVDVNDVRITRIEADFDLGMDAITSTSSTPERLTVQLDAVLALSDFGIPVSVTPPPNPMQIEGFDAIPADALIPLN